MLKLAVRSYNIHHRPFGDDHTHVGELHIGNPSYNLPPESSLELVDWSSVKKIPNLEEEVFYVSNKEKWSFFSKDNFAAKKFNPFESNHNSTAFEVIQQNNIPVSLL